MTHPKGSVLMVQGTASSAGKSLLVAGLCRLLRQAGYDVAPFKAQNMSNNAFVTLEGHEIGRAQAVQAQAACTVPHVDMNPVLLKPEADHRSQVIVMGKALARLHAAAYHEAKQQIWGDVTAALDRLRARHDMVIIEGAGSPAEINLKARDITNMSIARYADAPVLLVGDIDRGGVFAHLYGTHALLEPDEQALVRGFVINKLRGDPSLLEPGLRDIETMTGVPVAGVVPWITGHRLPEEDSMALDRRPGGESHPGALDVAVLRLPRIANFDDFDPLEADTGVLVRYVTDPDALAGADLVIIPGTKATIDDLAWLRARGLDSAIERAHEAGAAVIGICGGFQALGGRIADPEGIESTRGSVDGLGMLGVETTFIAGKQTRQTSATVVADRGLLAGGNGLELTGYEIHAGVSSVTGETAISGPGGVLGALDPGGWLFGCYLHGLFRNDAFRQTILANIARRRGKRYEPANIETEDAAFDRLADVLRSSLDLSLIDRLLAETASTSLQGG